MVGVSLAGIAENGTRTGKLSFVGLFTFVVLISSTSLPPFAPRRLVHRFIATTRALTPVSRVNRASCDAGSLPLNRWRHASIGPGTL